MKKNYKIALVTYSLSSGGLERAVANSTQLFEELGCEVHLFVIDSALDYPFSGRLHQFFIDKISGINKIRRYISLMKEIENEKFNLIIDHRFRINFLSEIFWQYLFYRKQNVINYVHSSKLENYIITLSKSNKYLFKNRSFICDSKGIQEKMNQQFPYFKTKTIYNPIKLDEINEDIEIKQPYILAVGRMEKTNVKQIDLLLKYFAESKLPENNFKLVILGDGETKQKMEKIAEDLKIKDSVDFKGFIKNPFPFYKNAFATVLTSKYEGFGLVLAESLLCGIPVISFDCETGPREIIQNRKNGLLIENQNFEAFKNALNELIENPNLYQKLKQNAKKSAEQFSLDFIKNEWKEFLKKLNDKH